MHRRMDVMLAILAVLGFCSISSQTSIPCLTRRTWGRIDPVYCEAIPVRDRVSLRSLTPQVPSTNKCMYSLTIKQCIFVFPRNLLSSTQKNDHPQLFAANKANWIP